MSYNPELLVTASTLDECKQLIEAGANAILVGESKFGSRLAGEFTIDMIAEAVQFVHAKDAKLYVSMNNLFDNATLQFLPDYLIELEKLSVDAIVYGDPSVLMAAREFAPSIKLHWNAEMTSTNYKTAEYWAKRGASRFVMARELNMEQIIEAKEKSSLEIQVQVHGMTAIYHSKRHLLTSYKQHHINKEQFQSIADAKSMYLMENDRPDERYPIYEDAYGTHIMSADDICMLENLRELLDVKVDSFKIEGMMKSPAYNTAVVKAYRQVIDTYLADPDQYEFKDEWLEPIKQLQDSGRELSFGFFFKEQVY